MYLLFDFPNPENLLRDIHRVQEEGFLDNILSKIYLATSYVEKWGLQRTFFRYSLWIIEMV